MVVAVLFIVRESFIWLSRLWAMDLLSGMISRGMSFENVKTIV